MAYEEDHPIDARDRTPMPARSSGTSDARRAEHRHTLHIALLTGIVGIVGILLGSVLQLYGAAINQESEFAEQRAKDDRDHRAAIYFKFLLAADGYVEIMSEVYECVTPLVEQSSSVDIVVRGTCARRVIDLDKNMENLSVAHWELFAYGSEETLVRAKKIYDDITFFSLVPTVTPHDDSVTVDGMTVLSWRDGSAPGRKYPHIRGEFLESICKEVPAQPRSRCKVQ